MILPIENSLLPLPAPVSPSACLSYREHAAELISFVDEFFRTHPQTPELTGNNPFSVLADNHRNHHAFLSTVFLFNQYPLLVETLPWVYRAYRNHGFSDDYFPLALTTWKQALREVLNEDAATAVFPIYDWMLSHHEDLIGLSQQPPAAPPPALEPWQGVRTVCLEAMLAGDFHRALTVVSAVVKAPQDVADLYRHVLGPAMVHVGLLWEAGRISVAQEHLASAVTGRLMAVLSAQRLQPARLPFRALVTAGPNEHHEIGAWMVADLLELAGWQVRYLGANTPERDLVSLAEDFAPHVLAISVTMAFNLDRALSAVRALRESTTCAGIRVLIGGAATAHLDPQALLALGVDGTAASAAEAVTQATAWVSP